MLGNYSRVMKNVAERTFATSAAALKPINNVTVIGGGLMGSGIAQVAAQHGNQVNLVDLSEDVLKKSRDSIIQSLKRIAKKQHKENETGETAFVNDAVSRITFSIDLKKAIQTSDLVLEAIVENLEIKLKLFESVEKIAPEHTILASNTSSIPIGEIASKSQRKDKFGGLHFFNPVPMMKLLEIVRIPETSEDTYQKMLAWGKSIGKATVTCKDTPGFIVNRLLIPYSNDAYRMVERGDATPEDIDIAMKLGTGAPMGPFERADLTGIDLALSIRKGWRERFPDDPKWEIPELIQKMVKEGKFGRKTGEGFYKYMK